jgi:putative SOS response-associated peptidase YedK
MCGRFANSRTDAQLVAAFGIDEVESAELAPSYNVAPTQDVRIIVDHAQNDATGDGEQGAEDGRLTRQLRTARWGLVPFWAKGLEISAKMINARAETVTEKRAYQQAAKKRRCLVPADGFFEWSRDPRGHRPKQPYFLHAKSDDVLAFAGLYELWKNPEVDDGDPHRWLLSTTILTRPAEDAVGEIHDRMPVVLPPEHLDAWLDPTLQAPNEVRDLLAAIPDPRLVPRPVATAVNNVRNDGAELLEAVTE